MGLEYHGMSANSPKLPYISICIYRSVVNIQRVDVCIDVSYPRRIHEELRINRLLYDTKYGVWLLHIISYFEESPTHIFFGLPFFTMFHTRRARMMVHGPADKTTQGDPTQTTPPRGVGSLRREYGETPHPLPLTLCLYSCAPPSDAA